jgi:hypothetical protein
LAVGTGSAFPIVSKEEKDEPKQLQGIKSQSVRKR